MLKAISGYESILFDLVVVEWEFLKDNFEYEVFGCIDVILKFLETFFKATKVCSGVYYSTTNMTLPHLRNIAKAFKSVRGCEILYDCLKPMEAKFMKYFEDIPMLLCFGSVLDPRTKLFGTTHIIEAIGNDMGVVVGPTTAEIEQQLEYFYQLYVAKFAAPIHDIRQQMQGAEDDDDIDNLYGEIFQAPSQFHSSSNIQSEYVSYINTQWFENRAQFKDLDVLMWWKEHATQFPILSLMARDYLCPPVSTCPSESAFSAGKRTITDQRTCLSTEMVEALILNKDWADAEKRRQHIRWQDEMLERQLRGLGFGPSSAGAGPSGTANEDEDEDEDYD